LREALAAAAHSERLPFEVRAVGEAFRALGRAAADREIASLEAARRQLRETVKQAREKHGDEPLLRLRAVQAELFSKSLEDLAKDRRPSIDLVELGGELSSSLLIEGGRVPGPLADVASAFAVRWTSQAGLVDDPRFAPTLNDWRSLLRIRLVHPRGTGRERLEDQLEAIRVLERLDPDYPASYAKGVVLYRLGDYAASASAFRAFLQTQSSGKWQIRARNHLLAATRYLPSPEPEAE
jgi:hypothetical protein